MRKRSLLLPGAMVACLVVLASMLATRRGPDFARIIEARQADLLHRGWSVTWTRLSTSGNVLSRHAVLENVRVLGPMTRVGRVLYAADRLEIGVTALLPQQMTLKAGPVQAVALTENADPSSPPSVALRMLGQEPRLTLHGLTTEAHQTGTAPTPGPPQNAPPDTASDALRGLAHRSMERTLSGHTPYEVNGVLTDSTMQVDIERAPFIGSHPESLRIEGLRLRLSWVPDAGRQASVAIDASAQRVLLPMKIPGLGASLDAPRIAVSLNTTGATGATSPGAQDPIIVMLHLAKARLGPVSAALSGRLHLNAPSTGDFDLVVSGLSSGLRQATQAGAASPELAQATDLLERAAAAVTSGEPMAAGAQEATTDSAGATTSHAADVPLSLPVTLRSGHWSVGPVPFDMLWAAITASSRNDGTKP